MVGEGVLHECLIHPKIEAVTIVVRKGTGLQHAKLKEIVHPDFFDLSAIENQLQGFDACFFCLGVSSVGMNETDYRKMTYTLTLNFAKTLAKDNKDLCFCYVSGAATDSSEKGKVMWARVKGKTENDLTKMFIDAYMFRPGYMHPTPGLKNTLKFYTYIKWMYPLFKIIMPNAVSTLADLGKAMINAALRGFEKKIIEVKDIKILAKK